MSFNIVLLPLPLSPIIAVIRPSRMPKESPWTATVIALPGKDRLTFSPCISGRPSRGMSLGTEQDGGDAGMITIKKPSRDIPGRHKNTKYIDRSEERRVGKEQKGSGRSYDIKRQEQYKQKKR